MDNFQKYDDHADTISVDDITENSNNRHVMRRIKNNDADYNNVLYIQNEHDDDGEECIDYVPEGSFDMGWLGYFVGKYEHLEELNVRSFTPTSGESVRDVLETFFRGVNCNTSIRKIYFQMDANLLGGEVFTMLGPLFEKTITI